MAEVSVDLGANQYTIHITTGGLKQAGDLIASLPVGRKALVITDENVGPLYAEKLTASLLSAGLESEVMTVAAGEASKSLHTADAVYSKAITMGLDRKSPIIALGGGVVGDLAGFVAATYLRGVPFIQVPTTLLAQVDSSVGGKTAVNHTLGKNLVGAFYQPSLVVIDPEVLETLPARELKAGLAEVIKYGVIADAEFFTYLAANTAALLARNPVTLTAVIKKCCELKAAVVAEDERETSLRMILNFGHTIGHAVEAVGGYSAYNHGEAVAVGMHGAALISKSLGLCDQHALDVLTNLLGKVGLPMTAPGFPVEELLCYLARDKKAVGGEVSWILMAKIGEVRTVRGVAHSVIKDVLTQLT